MRSEFPLNINAKSFCSPPPQWVGNCQVTHNIWQSWLYPESHTPPQSQCYRPNSIPASSRTLSTSLAPVPNCIHCFYLPSEGEIHRNQLQYPSTSSRPQLQCHTVYNLASKADSYSCSASRTSSSIGSYCCCCSSSSSLRSSFSFHHAYAFQITWTARANGLQLWCEHRMRERSCGAAEQANGKLGFKFLAPKSSWLPDITYRNVDSRATLQPSCQWMRSHVTL